MRGGSLRSWMLITTLLAAAGTAGYDIYLRTAAPNSPPIVVHDPPTAEDIARATEPIQRELDATKLRLAAITGDRDNLKQQLDASRQQPAPPSADQIAKATAALQKQLEAATRQRDAAASDAAASRRRTQQPEAQPHPLPVPSPAAGGGKVYTQRTIAELRELYEGRDASQSDAVVADDRGKWIETTGMRILGIGGSGVLMLKKDNSNVQCTFDDPWKAKLATLRVGDLIKVSGKLNQNQNGQLIYLEDCELRD